jgi:peptide-methionine (S)-S-oxide reductase
LNGQGNDVGPQYRSVVFYVDEGQKEDTEAVIERLANHFSSPIVTEVKLLTNFFMAENYHHDYFANNPGNPYCRIVVAPKIAKTRAKHASLYE